MIAVWFYLSLRSTVMTWFIGSLCLRPFYSYEAPVDPSETECSKKWVLKMSVCVVALNGPTPPAATAGPEAP